MSDRHASLRLLPRLVRCDHGRTELCSEITLGEDLSNPHRLRPILRQLAETVAPRIKKAGIYGGDVTLKLKTADFAFSPAPARGWRCLTV